MTNCLNRIGVAVVWLTDRDVRRGDEVRIAGRTTELTQAVVDAYRAGDYARGVELAERALALARAEFGETHPATLASLDSLAFESLEMDHRPVEEALRGSEVAMKIADPVRRHDQVFRIRDRWGHGRAVFSLAVP